MFYVVQFWSSSPIVSSLKYALFFLDVHKYRSLYVRLSRDFFLYSKLYIDTFLVDRIAIDFMKKLLITLSLLAAVYTFAADYVEIRTVNKRGQTSVQKVELQDMGSGVERLHIPIRKIPLDAKYIDIVHEFAKAKKGDNGYWVSPNSKMGTFRLDNSKYKERNLPLHVHGVKTDKKTFAAIVKGLRFEYSVNVIAKNGNYEVFPRFEIEAMGFSPYEDIIIDYYTLTGNDANYSGMGRTYRNYMLESGVVKPIKERMKTQPHLEYAYQAPEIRIRQAWKPVPPKIEHQTLENEPPVKPVVTFERVEEIIDELKSKGVEKAELCLVGWNISGHDGRYPEIFPVEPKLGGEEKLKKLIKKAKNAGYLIVCHTNNTDCYTIANTYSDDIVAKNFDGSLQKNAAWAGGRMFNLCGQVAWGQYVPYDLEKIRKLGFEGLHYIDVISCVAPRNCHDKAHPLNRKQWSAYMNTIMKHARDVFGGSASEGPFDYVAGNMDYALYISFNILRKQHEVVDRCLPLWQIVYNGIILSNPSAETTNYTLKDAKSQLKFIEFGGRPAFYYHSAFRDDGKNWMGVIDLRCQTQEELKQSGDALKRAWDEYGKLKHLQLEFMDSHEEIAKDVFITRWSNGDEIVSNYSNKDFEYKGDIVKPMSYNFVRPNWFMRLFR